jgi:ATP-dependent protease Clp ATPase subunit
MVVQATTATILSLPALARVAERYVREHGTSDVDQVVDHLVLAANFDRERAQAGLKLAVIGRLLVLDRDATIALWPITE